MNRRRLGFHGLIGLAVLGSGFWLLSPRPMALITPGLTEPLNRMVHVQGGSQTAAANLRMVAVTVLQPRGWQRLLAWFRPTVAVAPLATVLSDVPFPQYWVAMQGQMWLAQRNAAVVGESLAGTASHWTPLPGVEIVATLAHENPGREPLGARLVAINTHPLHSVAQAYRLVAHAPSSRLALTVVDHPHPLWMVRSSTTLQPFTLAGWVLAPAGHATIPHPVHIARDGIAGSSGGLMFALAVVAESQHHPLDPGRLVAGTGEITPTGRVLAIADVPQKVVTVARAGASVFFVPMANAPAARAMAHRLGDRSLQIVPVSTVAQALHWLTHPPRSTASVRPSVR